MESDSQKSDGKQHQTHQGKEESKREEGVEYKPTMGTPLTKEEVEAENGYYDEHGFFILEDGSFYDPWGYKFDEEGYDEYGGFYDDYGYYVPGDEYADKYYEDYDYGDVFYQEDEEDEEERRLDEEERKLWEADMVEDEKLSKEELDAKYKKREEELEKKKEEMRQIRLALNAEHIVPAIEWLKKQPDNKKFVAKIGNLPIKLKQESILENYLKKKIPQLKISMLLIEKDKVGKSLQYAWFQSDDKNSLIGLLKLHNMVWAGYKIKTFLMGFPYDDLGEEDVDDDAMEKRMLKMDLEDYGKQSKLKKQQQEEEKKQPEKKEEKKKAPAQNDDDEFQLVTGKIQ